MRTWKLRLTLGGALFLLALALTGAGSFLSGNNLLFLIFAAMMALLLVSGFLSRLVLSGLELELLLPEHVSARTPSPARVRIRNLKRLTPSFSIELSGVATDAKSILTKPVYFPVIPGRGTVEAAIEVVFPRRGSHRENLFKLTTGFPFGFLRKSTTVALRRETLVYPAFAADEDLEALLDRLAGDNGAQLRGSGQDFYSIRPYEPQDSARHVDWKSTAHAGKLQIREFARNQRAPVEVRLDPRMMPGEQSAFENLLERCAFISYELAALETDLWFRCRAFEITVPGGGNVYDILRFLSLIEPATASAAQDDDQPVDFPPGEPKLLILFSTAIGDAGQQEI